MEDGRLRSVEVLGLALPHDTATKRYAAPLQIVHGKHHALEEAVDEISAFVHEGEVRTDELVTGKPP